MKSCARCEGDAPERLPQQFGALTTMKLVEKIVEVTRRRLLVSFQTEQRGDVLFVKLSMRQSNQETGFLRNSSR